MDGFLEALERKPGGIWQEKFRAMAKLGRELPWIDMAQCNICAAPYPASKYRYLCWNHEQLQPQAWPD